MQPTDGFSVPRRALDVEDYIDILRRHKGWIFGPFLLTLVVSVVGVHLWPNTYQSSAVIQIKPQQISQQLVPEMRTQDILERISSLANQVKSRSQLSAMLTSMNLYPRERNRMPTEDVIEIMNKAIVLTPTASAVSQNRTFPAFQITFTYYNRYDAAKVVQALTSKFLDEDGLTRNASSYMMLELMQDQFDQKKARLDEADSKMTAWKLQNPYKLPEQYQSNMTTLTALQNTQLNLQSQMGQAGSDKLVLEGQIELMKQSIENVGQETKVVTAQAPKAKNPKVVQAENLLERAQANLEAALRQFSAKHPTTMAYQRDLDGYKLRLEEAQKAAAVEEANEPVEPLAAPVNLAATKQINQLNINIKNHQNTIRVKEEEIERYRKSIAETARSIEALNARVQSMPVGDAEYKDLAREQAQSNDAFLKASLDLDKVKMSQEVEVRKQGEKLELLDPASLPVDPTDPNRPLIISMGAGLGLVLGLVMAGAREMKDTSLKNLKDVRAYTQLTILGSVPLLENDFVVRRRRRIAWLGWTIACLVAVLVMAGAIVYYVSTK